MSLEFTSACRTCLDENSKYYQIYDYVDENHTIIEMLDVIVPQIKVKEEDDIEFSSLMCESCVEKLVISYNFQCMAMDSDTQLRQLIHKPMEPVEEIVFQEDEEEGEDYENLLALEEHDLKLENTSDVEIEEIHTNIEEVHEDGSNQLNDVLPDQENDGEENQLSPVPFKIIKLNTRKRFSCTDCGKIYDRIGRIEHHLLKKHNLNAKEIQNFIKYSESLKDDSQMDEWNAYFADNIIVNESKGDLDDTDGKTIREYACKVCKKVFNCMSRLKRHIPVHADMKPYTCDICLRGCSTINAFNRHKLLHTVTEEEDKNNGGQTERFKCPYCPKSFPSKNSLSAHRISHSHINASYSCDFCQRKYMSLKTLSKHIVRDHPDTTYPCDRCDKKFPQKEQLERHMYSHREIQLSCDICQKSFTSEFALKEHNYIHTGENPYLCPTCGKAFKYSSSLRKHIERHTEEKKFQCPQCNRCFKCSVDVKKHIKTHLGIRPYRCNICGFRCTRSTHLKRHRESHAKKSFHKCTDCQRMYPSLQSLRRHICAPITDDETNM
ncbi:uncharacterized protein LOC142228710 [Haematobia irritans]|uniref:uncharacterized protein LOC142228710 n=1 Tax=Haematobia irritans TaxID=7368 RepID=UPI003F4FFF11